MFSRQYFPKTKHKQFWPIPEENKPNDSLGKALTLNTSEVDFTPL